MKETIFMSKDGSNLSKTHFGCYFRRGSVNFKNLIILFLEHIGYLLKTKYQK